MGTASLCSCTADLCIYEHLVNAATGLLFVGSLQRCTVKIVFREYSKVELVIVVANQICPLIDFFLLIEHWLHGLAFQEQRKKHMSQRSLILLPLIPPGGCACGYPPFSLQILTAHAGPKHWFVTTRCGTLVLMATSAQALKRALPQGPGWGQSLRSQLLKRKRPALGRSRTPFSAGRSIRHRGVLSLKWAFTCTSREPVFRPFDIISLDVPPIFCPVS